MDRLFVELQKISDGIRDVQSSMNIEEFETVKKDIWDALNMIVLLSENQQEGGLLAVEEVGYSIKEGKENAPLKEYLLPMLFSICEISESEMYMQMNWNRYYISGLQGYEALLY